MNKAQPTVKTYQRISALLETSLKTILSKELHNTDTIYGAQNEMCNVGCARQS